MKSLVDIQEKCPCTGHVVSSHVPCGYSPKPKTKTKMQDFAILPDDFYVALCVSPHIEKSENKNQLMRSL